MTTEKTLAGSSSSLARTTSDLLSYEQQEFMDRLAVASYDATKEGTSADLASFFVTAASSRLVSVLICSSLTLNAPTCNWLAVDPFYLYLPSIVLALPILLFIRNNTGLVSQILQVILSLTFAASSVLLAFQAAPPLVLLGCLFLSWVCCDALRLTLIVRGWQGTVKANNAIRNMAKVALVDLIGTIAAFTLVLAGREHILITSTLRICALTTMLCALVPLLGKKEWQFAACTRRNSTLQPDLAFENSTPKHSTQKNSTKTTTTNKSTKEEGYKEVSSTAKLAVLTGKTVSDTVDTTSNDTRMSETMPLSLKSPHQFAKVLLEVLHLNPLVLCDIGSASFCCAIPAYLLALTIGGTIFSFSAFYGHWLYCALGVLIGLLSCLVHTRVQPYAARPGMGTAFLLAFLGGMCCLFKSSGPVLSLGLVLIGIGASTASLACVKSIDDYGRERAAQALVLWQILGIGAITFIIAPYLNIKTSTISSVLFFRSLAVVQALMAMLGSLFYLTKRLQSRSKAQIAWRL